MLQVLFFYRRILSLLEIFGLLQSSLGINILPLVLQKQLTGYENIHILFIFPPFTLPKFKLNISNLGL
jgi:hypothetical protein